MNESQSVRSRLTRDRNFDWTQWWARRASDVRADASVSATAQACITRAAHMGYAEKRWKSFLVLVSPPVA